MRLFSVPRTMRVSDARRVVLRCPPSNMVTAKGLSETSAWIHPNRAPCWGVSQDGLSEISSDQPPDRPTAGRTARSHGPKWRPAGRRRVGIMYTDLGHRLPECLVVVKAGGLLRHELDLIVNQVDNTTAQEWQTPLNLSIAVTLSPLCITTASASPFSESGASCARTVPTASPFPSLAAPATHVPICP